MKPWTILALLATAACSQAGNVDTQETDVEADADSDPDTDVDQGHLVVNEILASNAETNTDENDEYDDWFELYNPTGTAIDLDGWTISDSGDTVEVPDTLIVPAHGYLLIWCDDESDQGVAHVDFKFASDGDTVELVDTDDNVVDSVDFPAQTTDVSYGRSPDGGTGWESFDDPTPGASNGT